MLRLEKVRKNHDIEINVRPKIPIFNRLFCVALAWAVGIHLFWLLIFHIAPIKINYQNSIYPPVTVASDLGKKIGNTLAFLEEDLIIPEHLLLPNTFYNFQLEKPYTPLNIQKVLPQPSDSNRNFFADLEKNCLMYDCLPIVPPMGSPLKIHFSGPLASYATINDHVIALPSVISKLKKKEYHLAYEVLLDAQKGKIVWINSLNHVHPSIQRWGENEVKKMIFEKSPQEVFVRGSIEFSIQYREEQE